MRDHLNEDEQAKADAAALAAEEQAKADAAALAAEEQAKADAAVLAAEEQAKAAAALEAEERAKADAAALAKLPRGKARQKAKADPEDRAETLRYLAEMIAAHETVTLPVFLGMVDELEEVHGAEIDDDATPVTITMAGITARGAGGTRQAVVNWANAARRALLDMA